MSKGLGYAFKDDTPMVSNPMKTCSASPIMREVQTESTATGHSTLTRMAIKSELKNSCWRGCGEIGNLAHCKWGYKMVQLLENNLAVPQKVKTEFPYVSGSLLQVQTPNN